MSKRIEIETNLSNYYGTVVFVDAGDECVIELDDHDRTHTVVISREFFEAAKKEFQK